MWFSKCQTQPNIWRRSYISHSVNLRWQRQCIKFSDFRMINKIMTAKDSLNHGGALIGKSVIIIVNWQACHFIPAFTANIWMWFLIIGFRQKISNFVDRSWILQVHKCLIDSYGYTYQLVIFIIFTLLQPIFYLLFYYLYWLFQ